MAELAEVPRPQRRAAVVELLSEAIENAKDIRAVEPEVEAIANLGSRWRDLLLTLAAAKDIAPEVRALLHRYVRHETTRRIELRERQTGLRPEEIQDLLGRLESSAVPRAKCHLRVHFDTPHAYIYGLCAIAAWASQNASDLEITYSSAAERVKYFLDRSGFIEALRDPQSDPVGFDTDTIRGFTRVPPGESFDTDSHAARLVDLFHKHAQIPEKVGNDLSIAFSELIENCVRHGEITSPGWLFANYHPEHKIMHVCICDRGIGVQESFARSDQADLVELARHPMDWIKRCTDPLVTSKSTRHAGYGLYLVRELCRQNGGQFVAVSGRASYRLWHRRTASGQLCCEERVNRERTDWKGLLIGLQFHLDGNLDLGAVYQTLPPPRGYEGEDLDLFES